MTQSKESQARKYMTGIERNYPGFASTFGYCPTNNCSGSGRGSGLCANCYEEKRQVLLEDLATFLQGGSTKR